MATLSVATWIGNAAAVLSGRFGAIVAAAFVVDGGIYRHDFVSGTVIDALMKVQLETEVPILSAVLTPQAFHDHDDHHAFFRDHFKIKGREVAGACAQTIENLASVARYRSCDS